MNKQLHGPYPVEDDDTNTVYETATEDNDSREGAQGNTNDHNVTGTPIISNKLDDIIAAFKPFKGELCNVKRWVAHFEEQCRAFHLSEFQKFIFAKKVMRNTAKLFVEHESKATNWTQLKNELMLEFGQPINSVLVHQILSQRKKKNSETSLEYLYDMISIGSQGNVDTQAILTHTVNGLPGPSAIKHQLYDCSTIQEFKRRLNVFELQNNLTNQTRRTETYEGKPQEHKERCSNCGSQKHPKEECPDKKKGPKCFNCNEFGHLSAYCEQTDGTTAL